MGVTATALAPSSQAAGRATDARALLRALRRDRSVEFGREHLADHLPMALAILDRLGASPARLEAFAAAYDAANERPGPAPIDRGRIDRGNWRDHLGDRAFEGCYRGFFLREVRDLGADAAQRLYLPALVPGLGASALHGLMRLAYADLARDEDEVATALGYWACAYLPLRSADATTPQTDDPLTLLVALDVPALRDLQPPTDLLWHWMRAAAASPAFPDVAALLAPVPSLPERVAAASLALMAGTMSFEALHAVTGCHWLRLLRRHLPDGGVEAARYLWQAVAALYPKLGCPALPTPEELDDMRHRPCPPWPEIVAAAVASDDEHDVSLAYSAREEEAHRGDRLYRVVAARRLGLVP